MGGGRIDWRVVAGLILAGSVVRIVLALISDPDQFDTGSYLIVSEALRRDPLEVYDVAERWPYPPAFLPWVLVATSGPAQAVLPFEVLIRLPMIVSDALIALLVQDYLGRRGAGERLRVLAVGVVALGPVFLAVSGYHGQLDSVAILPAVAALWVWQRGGPHRAVLTGVLIGTAAAVKSVPLFMLLAFLPWIRSRRELTALVAPALLIPFALLLPFLAGNGPDTVDALRSNRGFSGFNGISLIVLQPRLADLWESLGLDPAAFAETLTDVQHLMVLGGVAVAAIVIWRRRLPPAMGAGIIWLAVFAFNPNFAWQYLVWGLPFFVMAGYVREVALFQVIAALPLVLFYWPGDLGATLLDFAYTPVALLCWLALVAAFVQVVGGSFRPRHHEQPA
jgi:uncharacterized membrane protein